MRKRSADGCRNISKQTGTRPKPCACLFLHVLSDRNETPFACISQTEAVSSVLGITEYIGSCLVDRYGSCIGCRIRIFLSYMQL